jgi:hypothetical protein
MTRMRATFGAGAGLVALACSAPPPEGDLAAAQVAAATEVARGIASNPGPLQTICVAYSGGWEDPPLPSDVAGIAFAYAEGCQEIDGQLFARGSGPGGVDRRAIWLGVSEPEGVGAREARVRVFTSTGLDDAASYACTVRRRGGGWTAEGCSLEAIG